MADGLPIRTDVASPSELRRLAKKERRRRTVQRMLAIANALEGLSRADAARAAGIERQSLRDAVLRSNAEGLAGLVDRPNGRRPELEEAWAKKKAEDKAKEEGGEAGGGAVGAATAVDGTAATTAAAGPA